MAYTRMDPSRVKPRWLVLGTGEDRDLPPFSIYVQTHWGLSSLKAPTFDLFDDAVEFLDREIIGLTRLDNAS